MANDLTAYVKGAFQLPTEHETAGDASFRWRKYGQKAVNGNSFPR
jgi:hypothetical protein